MKYIYNILFLTIGFALLQSCGEEYLSPVPNSAVAATNYFTTESQLETGVINMYDGIQGVNILADTDINKNHAIQFEYYVTEMRSDNTRTKNGEGEPAQFDNFTVEATNGIVSDYYRSFYNVIFRANTVLANLDVASDAVAAQYEGEARFVRAYAYFNLVRLFGDIPLIDRVVAPLETEVQYTRVASSQIYDLIVSDLQVAAANLDDSSKNRASKSGAEALLAKVHLTIGNYGEARTLCESVMGAGFALEANFKDVFYNEGNNEVIFAIGFAGDNNMDSQNFSTEWLNAVGRTAGVNYLTSDAVSFLNENGGDRTAYSYRQDALQPTQNQVVKYLPNGDEELGIAPTSSDPSLAGNDWVVLRYADVLLMHVEAIIGSGVNTADAAALASYREVRERAGFTDALSTVSKAELLDERRAELAFENQRFFDLVRFGAAQEVLSNHASNTGGSFSGTDLLLPIPQREIGLSNGMLTQNPGY